MAQSCGGKYGENLEARDAMSYAQYLAGMAFNNASLGYVHAMAHQLGGFYNPAMAYVCSITPACL